MKSGVLLLAAFLAWLPGMHLALAPPQVRDLTERLEAGSLERWSDPDLRRDELAKMRRSNAEWDFMARTFTVLALANRAAEEPDRVAERLEAIDAILEATLALEASRGPQHFMMPYARARPFVVQPARSLFVDGEIALMLGARRMIRDDPQLAKLQQERVEEIVDRMARSPVLCVESYPDECWTFCHTMALAAIKLHDLLDGADHSELFRRWKVIARSRLTDARTGLLISSYTHQGEPLDGPEGSSIFLVAHNLQLIDPELAETLYQRAKAELGASVLGFGFAREWPQSWPGSTDVDSGPIVPLLGASPGASGLAIVAAAAFGDHRWRDQLLTSLELAAFPIDRGGTRRYAAGNAVGDAVIFYALAQGPMVRRASLPSGGRRW